MNKEETETVRLTQFSRGAGCGCKVAPSVLQDMLSGLSGKTWPDLIVGNQTKDDAAVYDLHNGSLLIATTDFFMPVVDDAFDFGRIAATNALSDVYAMGGRPVLALAVLGWPVEKLPPSLASDVLKGAQKICNDANIPLAGGHTVDSAEPFFGLAVNGLVANGNLKRNDTAKAGDLIYLTKPLGTGIVTTAFKRGLVDKEGLRQAVEIMTTLNTVGSVFGQQDFVHAMTDVTGFGLIGHLLEMCEGSDLQAEIQYDRVRVMETAKEFAKKFVYPDNTMRNWKSYEAQVSGIGSKSLLTLCDPQTSGGLLVSVHPDQRDAFGSLLKEHGAGNHTEPIGKLNKTTDHIRIRII